MKKFVLFFLSALALTASPALASPAIGEAAPSFTVKDISGKTLSSDKLKGKIVVLEWNNPTCPFVRKHYDSKNMQELQQYATDNKVVWLTINSGSPGKAGSISNEEAAEYIKTSGASPTHYILDPEGVVGQLYAAKTTPHMFVIDKKGKVAYMGAIDDDSSTDPEKATTAKNYVRAAIDALKDGKTVETASTQSYGCSVKYAN